MKEIIDPIFKDIHLFIYDFDGVMTNNTFTLDANGSESVNLNRSDGMAVQMIKLLGIEQIILSSEDSQLIKYRAKKLDITCFYGVENKLHKIKEIIQDRDIKPINIGYIGNDINDLDAISIVGLRMCPSDSEKSIKDICNYKIDRKGGFGVIRELYFKITGE
jgi:YrbI family 3-deoxy-D-manno-octulosonate 8-phosphate phosphatase